MPGWKRAKRSSPAPKARFLLSVLAAAAVASAASVVKDLEKGYLRDVKAVNGLCDTVPQEAGYFNIDAKTNKNYFYWSFSSRNNPATDPVVLWLTGAFSKHGREAECWGTPLGPQPLLRGNSQVETPH